MNPAPLPPLRPGVRLLWEADAVLALVPQLCATGFIANLARLREKLAGMLLDFQMRARAAKIEAARVAQATAVLAALIDHVVTSMPWGVDSGWQSLSTSSALGTPPAHLGDVRAAQRLLEVARASSSDAGLSELIAVALALGFDGRSRGADQPLIDQVRAQLAAPAAQRGPHDSEHGLSPEWRSSVQRAHALTSWLPLWVSSASLAALLAMLFVGLELSLGAKSDKLYLHLAALNAPSAIPPRPMPAPQARLAGPLEEEVAARDMVVRDEIDRSVIIVPDARLFEAGDATLRPGSDGVLRPIATALQQVAGRIQVIGHTDGTLARSARYPSEWELSVDRARAVHTALRDLGVEASRLVHDGRASIEPLMADDRVRGVGGDGRIEIVLLVGR